MPNLSSRSLTITIALLSTVAAVVFFATLIRSTVYAPDLNLSPRDTPGPPVFAETMSLPARLQIPALSIDAHVQYVGRNGKGEMSIPSNFKDVAWYEYGTVPGQVGSAVMAGHIDNGLALPGVFKYLGDLKIGDDVYVLTKDGSRLHFVVSDIETYPYNSGPLEQIFGATDAARLNLITCTGTWVRGKQTYSERLVVYTTYSAT